MRAPPPFEMDCRETAPWRAAQAALWALAGACLGAWGVTALDALDGPLAAALQGPAPALAGVLALTAAAAGLGWRLARPLRAHLAWTGREWVAGFAPQPAAGPAQVRLMIDLGGWLLLRVRVPGVPGGPGGRARWLGVARAAAGADWHLLRAALYCPPFELPAPRDQGGAPS